MKNIKYKTYEEVMSEIKKENYEYYKNIASNREGEEKERIEAMLEMTCFDDLGEDKNEIEIIENNCIYKLQNDMVINTGFINREEEKKYDKTIYQIAKSAYIKGMANSNVIEVTDYKDFPIIGKIVFEDEQKVDRLQIRNVGVKGKFNVSQVIIQGITNLDICLDVKNKSDCTYLAIEPHSGDMQRNIRGKITMSEDFYNQLTTYNRKYLSYVMIYRGVVHLWVGDKPYTQYEYERSKYKRRKIKEEIDINKVYNKLAETVRSINE